MPRRAASAGTGRTSSHGLVEFLEAAAAGQLQKHRCQVVVGRASRDPPHLVDGALRDDPALLDDADPMAHLRSEERRVGKESRARWETYQCKDRDEATR